jgi:hypothetical protein
LLPKAPLHGERSVRFAHDHEPGSFAVPGELDRGRHRESAGRELL